MMVCEVCGHRLILVNEGRGSTSSTSRTIWWCYRCGSLRTGPVWFRTESPALVDQAQQLVQAIDGDEHDVDQPLKRVRLCCGLGVKPKSETQEAPGSEPGRKDTPASKMGE